MLLDCSECYPKNFASMRHAEAVSPNPVCEVKWIQTRSAAEKPSVLAESLAGLQRLQTFAAFYRISAGACDAASATANVSTFLLSLAHHSGSRSHATGYCAYRCGRCHRGQERGFRTAKCANGSASMYIVHNWRGDGHGSQRSVLSVTKQQQHGAELEAVKTALGKPDQYITVALTKALPLQA